ncbi:MAG TPA: peptidoglycan-binding protein, partial [Candidatus Paceibacterota bacterium]
YDIGPGVQALFSKLGGQSSADAEIAATGLPLICSIPPARSLSQGLRGDDVRRLQEFLYEGGYLEVQATGYFGPATKNALLKYQGEMGIAKAGILGPKTREHFKNWCASPKARFTAYPERGPAPLSVNFTASISIANPNYVADAGYYKVVFGDGAEQNIPCVGNQVWCEGPHVVQHTYIYDGTLTARLVHYGFFGPTQDSVNGVTVGRKIIRVGNIACTMEYSPVCASKPIVCITTPCNPIQETYSNKCMAYADGASVLYEGQCRGQTPNPANDPSCKSWFDGCNSCSRSEPGGPAMCTLRACTPESMQTPYCSSYFPQTNRAPVVSGLTGPTTLAVSEVGTWSINASDPENGQLSYSISWGDEWVGTVPMARAYSAESSAGQKTTFTHSYGNPGTYTVRIVVRDKAGAEAQASATVNVAGRACTKEYVPVCGRPAGCSNPCPPGFYCAMMCRQYDPVTYSNRCALNDAGADYLYDGACRP